MAGFKAAFVGDHMQGTIAVLIKSESADYYLYCFENDYLQDIEEYLTDNLDMYSPICHWMTNGPNEDFVSGVDTILEKLTDLSWERNDDE